MSSRAKTESRADTAETKIQVGGAAAADKKSDKIGSNVIECSVNMNVSLSRLNKRSKIFQRAQSLLIVIIAIVFAIVCSHLKREVRALEVQIDCMNANLMVLMLRYDKLNKNFNRIWYHGSSNRSPHHPIVDSSRQPNQKYRHASVSKETSLDKVSRGITRVATSTRKTRYENERVPKIIGNVSEKLNVALEETVRSLDDREDAKINSERERYERAIVAFERRNQETTTAMPKDDLSDDTNTWNESRTGRYRRDEGRGKKRRKIKRRLKRSRRRLGPLVATFVGAVPEQHVTDTVYVGPWVKSTRNESRYAFNKFHLVEDKTSIEVTANGLYMISAQIYYFGEPTHYSYWILLSSEGASNTRKVIKCATVSAVSASEASCYTSVVLPLRRGDRLHIQQQERDRLINLREGHSYVQIMLLTSESPRRRGS